MVLIPVNYGQVGRLRSHLLLKTEWSLVLENSAGWRFWVWLEGKKEKGKHVKISFCISRGKLVLIISNSRRVKVTQKETKLQHFVAK